MIDPSIFERAYRHNTRNHIALSLIKEGSPLDQETFLKQFKKGDLDDAVEVGLVRLDAAGITLTEGLGRSVGARELAAEELRNEIEQGIRNVFSAVRQRITRGKSNPTDKSPELQ